jgi:hypothetical protein
MSADKTARPESGLPVTPMVPHGISHSRREGTPTKVTRFVANRRPSLGGRL